MKNTKEQQLFSSAATDAEKPLKTDRTNALNAADTTLKKTQDWEDSEFQKKMNDYTAHEVRHSGVIRHIKKNGKWIS